MPSLDMLKKYKNGEVHKYNSDMVIENTWWNDIGAQVAYIYDYDHDDEKFVLNNLNPEKSKTKTPIDIKYIVSASQTLDKDYVSYHIQLRPTQRTNVDYFDEKIGNVYNCEFPLSLYIDIKDNKGRYNKWMIVDYANRNDPQFSTYQILRCDYIYQWVYKGKKYQMAGVQRSQNS